MALNIIQIALLWSGYIEKIYKQKERQQFLNIQQKELNLVHVLEKNVIYIRSKFKTVYSGVMDTLVVPTNFCEDARLLEALLPQLIDEG